MKPNVVTEIPGPKSRELFELRKNGSGHGNVRQL
ncbi:hypothetical protein Asulf_00586 [Archaeoglobus sulfaticallidus PM70-1]|uniref:Uncharacterized protein n=1 Tax=Archaeoglobus sulfaticallidus PM70-1 TaxID=387631 RepID=N0BJF9_9EURY|nr:hypothetical protein Asulf_00586 [Archaeoglobus sulfaticallidus PM70-1]